MEKASKNFIANLKKQKRENRDLLFLDNVKIIKDALAADVLQPQYILTSLNSLDFNTKNAKVLFTDQKTIESLADTKTPQKVLCIAYHTQYVVKIPTKNFLVLDGLQDPGNVGTLIRTAKACGFESVFLLDSVNISNAKLIRSSVGAVLTEKIFEMSRADFCEFAKQNNLQLLCCDMNGENVFNFAENLSKSTQNKPFGVVVGNEGQGVSNQIKTLCTKTVKIPMQEGIESLNAAVSGSIVMYQLAKNNF